MSEDTGNEDLQRDELAEEHEEDGAQRGYTFEDMRLAVGDRLQIECAASTGVRRAFVRVVGYVDGISLLVTTPVAGGRRVELVENDPVIVRVFSRQSAFAFRASVLRACRLPLDYVHLSFPSVIQGSVIRKSTRVRTQFPVQVNTQAGSAAGEGTMLNLSATGALIQTHASLGEPGAIVRLRFDVDLHGLQTELDIEAEIRNVQQAADAEAEGIEYHYGVDFHELGAEDRMKIKSLVYQTIIEQPRRII
ncbi:MAG TPA: flagellar brake protein [Thauera aminoaromatica]|jgi:c-di-GMP-binding flagellar brake protein YcgR|uniref:Flagellar brake protein n=1 Tax=Thauera aminoaromatica TaxID=164330 RepID=A0A5C7S8Z9_THASP|nr:MULTISPECIES: flagellar brake protein [Thauera]MBL8462676.1 flagellar brake protein [Thauera sp.]MBP6132866.1 flagellar brake protein [Thauera sp.]MBP7048864.1 flagellar brake protein [Thauera sp.]MBX3684004.1 flagellar brake protein [Thauera sp.]TXH80354.1 MAG: flagellar brake protein [Thauera aminoaromatica]